MIERYVDKKMVLYIYPWQTNGCFISINLWHVGRCQCLPVHYCILPLQSVTVSLMALSHVTDNQEDVSVYQVWQDLHVTDVWTDGYLSHRKVAKVINVIIKVSVAFFSKKCHSFCHVMFVGNIPGTCNKIFHTLADMFHYVWSKKNTKLACHAFSKLGYRKVHGGISSQNLGLS